MNLKILLIEDNSDMALAIVKFLLTEKITVDHFSSFDEAQNSGLSLDYDCYLLDLNLPKLSGVEICKFIRSQDQLTPVIAITARDGVEDKITGFDSGFTDYIVKPFDLRELLARIKAHSQKQSIEESTTIQSGNFQVNKEKHKIVYNNQKLKLTNIEFNILKVLVERANLLVTTSDLIEEAWGNDPDIYTPPVRMHISNIRKKIKDEDYSILETVPGIGYKLNT